MQLSTRMVRVGFAWRRPWAAATLIVLFSAVLRAGEGEEPPVGADGTITSSGISLPAGEILERFGPSPAAVGSASADVYRSDDSLSDHAGRDRFSRSSSAGRAGPNDPAGGAEVPSAAATRPAEDRQLLPARPQNSWVRLADPQDRQVVARAREGVETGPWRDLLPLAIVLLVIGGAAWVVRRYLPQQKLLAGGGVIEVIARTSLSPKSSLVLVRLGRRLVLVGMSGEQMAALSTIDDPEQVALLLGEVQSRRSGSASQAFAEAFREEAHAYAETESPSAGGGAGDQIRGLLHRVRELAHARNLS